MAAAHSGRTIALSYEVGTRGSRISTAQRSLVLFQCWVSRMTRLNSAGDGSPVQIDVGVLYHILYQYWMLPSALYLVPISSSLYSVASDGTYRSDEISCCNVGVSTLLG